MTIRRNTPWSPRLTRVLRRMWRGGCTARQIANALNERYGLTLTRNAVIGKLHRMGMMGERRKPRQRPARVSQRQASRMLSRAQRHRTAPRPAPVKAMPAAPAPVRQQSAPAPSSHRRGVTDIMKLKPGMCRWVDGDRGAWVWCGAPTDGGSWCEHHRAIVFRKTKEEKQPCRA